MATELDDKQLTAGMYIYYHFILTYS
ncbi:unnamed protein product [Debaryomyces fabryi]|nr:unnamed protein product [Debaryomyces fabryi]